jgi:hypothetical protein
MNYFVLARVSEIKDLSVLGYCNSLLLIKF